VGAPHAEQLANGYGHRIDGNYLAVFATEDKAGEKLPKNATLLRALVFVLFFGLAFVWLGVCGWVRRRPEVCSPIRCGFTLWYICISDELSLPCWGFSGCRVLLALLQTQ